jgi:hypothetical protein
LTLEVAGASGQTYDLNLTNSMGNASVKGAQVGQVEGGIHFVDVDGIDKIRIGFPDDNSGQYTHRKVVLHFVVWPRHVPLKTKPGA